VVQYWIHNGMINVDGEKMSKSLGNFWTIKDALEKVDPLVLRYTMINAPYRQPIDFNQKMLDESSVHHQRMVSVYGEVLSSFGITDWGGVEILESASKRFTAAMNDDFNTRNAVVEIQSVVNSLRSLLDNGADADILAAGAGWLSEFAGDVLGLLPTDESIQEMMAEDESVRSEIESIVEPLLKERTEARASKDWPRADEIRDKLNELGVVVEDSPSGPVWRLQ
jgi:cysteinyl-tRNA synthetase